MRYSRVALLLLLALAGCNMFAPDAGQQTLSAEHDARSTEVAAVRQTATPAYARLSITLEAAQTGVSRSQAQTTRIAATLFALGTPYLDTRNVTPAPPAEVVPPGVLPSDMNGAADAPPPAVQPTIIGSGGAQGNSALISGSAMTQAPTATIDPTRPALVEPVTALAVGPDDCAVQPASEIPADAEGVYAAATAVNLGPANTLTAIFMRDGVEQVRYTWSPGFDIAQGCIWFYMPATDVALTAGAWTAQIDLDGQPGALLQFTVGGVAEPTAST